MSQVDNERPPYVMFERRAVEDRSASIAAGHYVAKDVDFAVITRPGSRDSRDKNAIEWLAELREKARQNLVPQTWYRGFQESYDAWKNGQTLPEKGTPIKGWQLLGPAAQETVIAAGFRTVEDLANADESSLQKIGTGAISIRLKAQGWLEAVKGTTVKIGIAWVDAWNATIRPGTATWAIAMMTASEFKLIALSKFAASVCSAALGIYLADRNLSKRGK